MKKLYNKSLILVAIILFSACGNKKTSAKLDFGEIHPGQTIEKTLTLSFNEEAKEDSTAFVEFVYETKDGTLPTGISFTLNGKPNNSNTLKFYAKDFKKSTATDVKIGISFPAGTEQKEYEGNLRLLNASADLQQYITEGVDKKNVKTGDTIGEWKAVYNDPIPLWIKILASFLSVLIIGYIIYFILSRDNMPLGHKTFQMGTISFPNGETATIRLEKLRNLNISKKFGIEDGLILVPYDTTKKGKKKRFARLQNQSSLSLRLTNEDGEKEDIFGTQDLFHGDEIEVKVENSKSYIFSYSNNKIKRTNL